MSQESNQDFRFDFSTQRFIGALTLTSTRKLRNLFLGTTLKSSVVKLLGGTAIAQLVTVAASPLLTRLYAPEAFGVAAVFAAVLGFLTLIGTLRFELAIPMANQDSHAAALLRICVLITTITAIGLALLLFCCPSAQPEISALKSIWPYRWMLPPLVFFCCIYQALFHFSLRTKQYALLARSRVRQSLMGTATGVTLGLVQIGPAGLILGTALSNCAGAVLLWRHKSMDLTLRGTSLRDQVHQKGGFALFTTAAAVLNASGTLLTPILIASFYTSEVTGSYSLASRMVGLPMVLVGTAAGQVFLSEASTLIRTNPSEVPRLFAKLTKKLGCLSAVLMLMGVASPFAFELIFGSRWLEAGYFAALLTVAASAQLIVSPVSQIALLLKKHRLQFGLDCIRAIVVFASLAVPAWCGVSPVGTVGIYSVGMCCLYLFSYFIYLRLLESMKTEGPLRLSTSFRISPLV